MENKEYQEIFDKTKGLQGEKLVEALLTFAEGNTQMEEEQKAMFARIDTYYEVIQSSKQYEREDDWVNAELQSIADAINAKSKDKVSAEDVKIALLEGENTKEQKSNT